MYFFFPFFFVSREQATDTPNLDGKVSWEGQTTWCIAKPSTGDERLNANIQFCCQQPDIDCSIIQPGGRCYNPNNYYSHASVVMHLYYKANYKLPHTCDFMQSGLIISQDPCNLETFPSSTKSLIYTPIVCIMLSILSKLKCEELMYRIFMFLVCSCWRVHI